jgi:hypothetical protein
LVKGKRAKGKGGKISIFTFVVQSQKSTLKQIIAAFVFAVYPPSEVDQQFGKGVFKEFDIPDTVVPFAIAGVNFPSGKGMYRWIYIAKVSFIGRNLPVGVQVIFL